MTVSSIVPSLSASKASPFLYTFGLFNWGELRQGDSIYIHGVGIVVGARGELGPGSDLSLSQGEDMHLLGMEDL